MDSRPLQIDLIRDEKAFLALESEWNTLLHRSSADGIFMTWEYLSNWWQVYGHDYHLRIFTARDADGTLVGIAPLMIGRGHCFPRKHFRHLTFLGGLGDSLAEYQDFIVERGREQELLPLFCTRVLEDLRGEWEVFYLSLVKETSPLMMQMLRILSQDGSHGLQLESRPCPHIPLPKTWDLFIQSKSKNFKKQFNNQWNRLHKNHKIEWVEAGKDIPIPEAMQIFETLNVKRWGDKGKTFQSKEFEAFHLKLAQVFAERGWLFLRLMKVDGQWAGARYDFVYGNKLWNYQNGWLPELSHLSLGKLLIGYSVKWCIENGLTEYDFLAGDSDYKLSWATDKRYLLTVEIWNPHSVWACAFQQMRMVKGLFFRKPPKEDRLAEAVDVAA